MCDSTELTTKGRITILLGKYQLTKGRRLSPRRLAQLAGVPKDLVYRLDAGLARYVDLQALARLCQVLDCRVEEILVWEQEPNGKGRSAPSSARTTTPLLSRLTRPR